MKIKILFAIILCVFVKTNTKAQFTIPTVNELTVVWEGAADYRPTTTFTIKVTKNGTQFSHTFSGPGVWAPPMFIGNNVIGDIQGLINGVPAFYTTYADWSSNAIVVGGPEMKWYFDTWNGKIWYFYVSKGTSTEWHYRIGN
ncbi:hypothetical protein [Taibaiella koreensis]|uniref:hypothetical protein n=1 Tax=Taibaiella koreensis TaxID=1268548 RepID=UPI000E59DCCB|nr:hypothetical protein [Taibaiella koreensis]